MKKYIILIIGFIICFQLSNNLFAQKKNKEILDDYFSRTAKSTVYEASDEFKPIEAGQWVLLRKYEGKKGTPVLFKYSVVGKEGDNFWIEVKDLRKKKTIVVKFLVQGIEGHSFAKSKIIDGKYTQNGEPGIAGMWKLFSMYLYPLQSKTSAIKQNADFDCVSGTYCSVWGHSGSFTREFSFDSPSVKLDIKSCQAGTMFYHPSVPFGIVGWNATNDKAEVIEFGFNGAVSEITD